MTVKVLVQALLLNYGGETVETQADQVLVREYGQRLGAVALTPCCAIISTPRVRHAKHTAVLLATTVSTFNPELDDVCACV